MANGHVEQQAISEMDFRTQFRTFETYGYARDPSLLSTAQTGFVGNVKAATELGGATIHDRVHKELRNNKDIKKKREKKGQLDQVDGPDAYKGPWAGYENDHVGIPVATDEEEQVVQEEPTSSLTVQNIAQEARTETTTFHGASEFDYLGRTYMAVPQDVDVNLLGEAGTQDCFIPKKLIHTWEGHEKGVSSIKFFPKSAHLLLSAGMDNEIKVTRKASWQPCRKLTLFVLDMGCLS